MLVKTRVAKQKRREKGKVVNRKVAPVDRWCGRTFSANRWAVRNAVGRHFFFAGPYSDASGDAFYGVRTDPHLPFDCSRLERSGIEPRRLSPRGGSGDIRRPPDFDCVRFDSARVTPTILRRGCVDDRRIFSYSFTCYGAHRL